MGLLSKSELDDALKTLQDWNVSENAISRVFTFDSYMDGIEFVNKLAQEAEAHNHHPDLTVGWCTVTVAFTSHDKGGVTDQCAAMAKIADSLSP